ncbi:MAG: signal peptide peptidase SppA, partial [Thermoguttaceae bacterium]
MDTTPHQGGTPEQPLMATIVQGAPYGELPRKRSLLRRIISFFVRVVFIGSLLLNVLLFSAVGMLGFGALEGEGRVQEKFFSHQRYATDKVAILSIQGMILSGEGFFKNQIDHALKDAKAGHLKALVVRVNSPGGTINGSDYMYYHLRDLAKKTDIPIVVSMGGLAASGGYYVSMSVGKTPRTVFAEPTSWTGSIGVIIPHYNVAGLMKEIGVAEDNVTSGPLKDMGSFARPMTPEERKIFQGLVDDGFDRFKKVVKAGRPVFQKNSEKLDKLATGQIFTADQALKNGLIDKIGFIEDAVDRAIELAHIDKNKVKVVKYKHAPSLYNIFFGAEAGRRSFLDAAAILEMAATPRAYYLYTWMAPI